MDIFQLCHYGPLDGVHAFKIGTLDDPLELREEKGHAKKGQVNKKVAPVL